MAGVGDEGRCECGGGVGGEGVLMVVDEFPEVICEWLVKGVELIEFLDDVPLHLNIIILPPANQIIAIITTIQSECLPSITALSQWTLMSYN